MGAGRWGDRTPEEGRKAAWAVLSDRPSDLLWPQGDEGAERARKPDPTSQPRHQVLRQNQGLWGGEGRREGRR